jgi:hypothetical protein
MNIDFKDLASRHPLFSRLTGQVIWLLFEEHKASSEDIDAFMEHYLAWRDEQLTVMAALEANRSAYLRITTDPPANNSDDGYTAMRPPCKHCRALHGAILPASHPDLIRCLPPFALGCRCRAEIISAEEVPENAPLIFTSEMPRYELHCASEWIFSVPWAKRRKG